jgi:hypothetical protein
MAKRPRKAEYVIRGVVLAEATREPVPDISVTAFDARDAKRTPLGRAVTAKNGKYELVLNEPNTTDDRTATIALSLDDRKGRSILTEQPTVRVSARQDIRMDFALPALEFGDDWPDIRYIQGEPVNIRAAASLRRDELVKTYRFLRGRGKHPRRFAVVRRAFPSLFGKRRKGDDCGEGWLAALRYFLEEKAGDADVANSDADDLPAGATIHWFYTAKIQVKYTTDTAYPNDAVPAALPAADSTVALSDGTVIGTVRANLADLDPANTEVAPLYVQRVGLIAENALTRYLSAAFGVRDPRNGAARLEYRIRQMPSGIAGQTNASWSHVEVAPSNSLIGNLHTVPHEMFHQVQYRYNNTTTRSGMYGALREGGARLIEDSINDKPNRWVDTASLIFSDPTQSLADSASVGTSVSSSTTINYAAGLFWKYFAEQHSTQTGAANEPAIGVDAYRRVLEAMATVLAGDPGVGYDPPALRTARTGMVWYGRFDQFRYYDAAMTELDSHETTWGNYLIANFLHGTANPVADRRFEYMEDEEAVSWPGSGVAKLAALQAVVQANDDLLIAQGASILRSVVGHPVWAARYYRVRPSGSPRLVRVNFNATGTMTDPLVQIVRLGPGNSIVDVNRSDRTTWSKTINLSGLDSLVVIVATRATAGNFSIQFDEVAAAADTMVTRWNSKVATEYQVDPNGWSWTWVSPDVMVDNDNNGTADTQVFFGQNNKLKVRLRNRGNQAAANLQLDFWYQKATPFLSAAAWMPLQDAASVTQQITGATLAAGATQWFEVNWAPVDDGTHHEHWCVKVKVTAPGEPNADNKMVLSNFSHVVAADPDTRLVVRFPWAFAVSELWPIPRGPRFTMDLPPHVSSVAAGRDRSNDGCACGDRHAVTGRPASIRAVEAKSKVWDGKVRTPSPAEGVYYPVDAKTLPPGVKSKELVTVAHVIDGEVVGGVTYSIGPRRKRPRR